MRIIKRIALSSLIVVLAVYFTGCAGLPGGIPGMGGGEKKEGSFDFEKTNILYMASLFGAYELTLDALIAINEAVDRKPEVVQLKQFREEFLKGGKENNSKFKETGEVIIKGGEKLKDLDIAKEAKGEDAKKHLGKSLLYTGVALFLDKKALDYGQVIVEKLPGEISANPLQATKLTAVLSSAKVTISTVPGQLKTLTNVFSNLSKYASIHGITVSAADQNNLVNQRTGGVIKAVDTSAIPDK